MDRSTARARLERMVAFDADPVLDDDEIEELVNIAQREDVDGILPGETGWTGTYDLNAAAAEGYRWKAAKVAGQSPFSADGASYDRGKATDTLTKMAAAFEARANAGAAGGFGYIEIESATGRGTVLPIANA